MTPAESPAASCVVRRMNYGHGRCIMVLVGEKMGIESTWADTARRHLSGESLTPTEGAMMEGEAIRINDCLRVDSSLVAQANDHVTALLVEYGFAEGPAVAQGDVQSRAHRERP